MSFAVELRPSVVDDVIDIRAWYEKERTGLGDEFLAAFYAELPKLQRNPAIYAPCYGSFRHAMLKRFPYGIYFRIEGETIVIYRAYHGARSAARLRKSLRDLLP